MPESTQKLNKDIFHYKCWFITCVLLIGYTYLHVKLTGIYFKVPLESWLDFTAPLPFGQRQFIPFLARTLQKLTSLHGYEVFLILEFLVVILTFFILQKLLRLEFNNKLALLLSWLFFLLLPLCTIINYRFGVGGSAAIFYPYDTPSLFFIILGFYLCLNKYWLRLVICIFFATLNRESSILILLLIPALHMRALKDVVKLFIPFSFNLCAYIVARLWIYYLTITLAGPHTQWYRYKTSFTNFSSNLNWLFVSENSLMFMFAFSGLPLLWFGFYDYIPLKYRPIRYFTFLYFLGLLGVGLVAETRIFTEIIGLLYLPICIAISNWLRNNYIIELQPKGLIYYLNRYIIFLLIILVLLSSRLIDWVIKQTIPVPDWGSF